MFGWLASRNILLIFLALTIGLLCHALIYGPLAAFVSEQFGTTARYTGASLGYQFATLLGAGFTPGILASIYAASQRDTAPVVLYLAAMSVVSAIFILLTKESKDHDLHTYEH